jgi:hypothetical protein
METVPVPKLTVSFVVDIELAYNSFGGKTAEEISEVLQDELHDLLFELSQAMLELLSIGSGCMQLLLDKVLVVEIRFW